MNGNHQSLSFGLLRFQKLLWPEGFALESDYLQGRTSDNTGHGYVPSLLLRVEEPMKQQGMPMYLHVHSVGEVHGWCKNFWTSLPCWWLHYGRAPSLHVGLRTPHEPGWRWVLNHRMLEMLDANLFYKLHSNQQNIIFRNIIENGSVSKNARGIT